MRVNHAMTYRFLRKKHYLCILFLNWKIYDENNTDNTGLYI